MKPAKSHHNKIAPLAANSTTSDELPDQQYDAAKKPKTESSDKTADESLEIGARLRYVRELFGLSQRELARRSGLTHGTVGGIERDVISPSVGSLRKILSSLPMTLSEFFSFNTESNTQIFFRNDELLEVGAKGLSLLQVGNNLVGQPLQIFLERYAPNAETAPTPYSHTGDEGGVIIKGKLEVTVGGVTRILEAGDAYLFPSRLPHRFRNVGDGEVIAVSANTPPL